MLVTNTEEEDGKGKEEEGQRNASTGSAADQVAEKVNAYKARAYRLEAVEATLESYHRVMAEYVLGES